MIMASALICKKINFQRFRCFELKYFFHINASMYQIQKLTRLRVIDNSSLGKQAMLEGKPAKCIHVYKKGRQRYPMGGLGDKVLVAIKGQMKKAYIVGVKQKQAPLVPKFDTNNIVLLDDNGNPLGTRILFPIPSILRCKTGEFTKLLSIATVFV